MSRHVVPDEVSVKVPFPDHEDRRALNRQTAYGRPVLEGSSRRCGCFHCGSSFAESEIKDWMPEEDGADTALCPYCGCDSVLYGTDEFPLTTTLLSDMYRDWFRSEYQERKDAATYVPSFSGDDDYQRRGIVFQMEKDPGYELVGEVELWRMGDISDWCYSTDDDLVACDSDDADDEVPCAEENSEPKGEPEREDKEAGGLLRIVTHGEGGASPEYDFVDERGRVLSYPLWGQRDYCQLRELLEKHGSRLMGLLVDPLDSKLRLVVKREESGMVPPAGSVDGSEE